MCCNSREKERSKRPSAFFFFSSVGVEKSFLPHFLSSLLFSSEMVLLPLSTPPLSRPGRVAAPLFPTACLSRLSRHDKHRNCAAESPRERRGARRNRNASSASSSISAAAAASNDDDQQPEQQRDPALLRSLLAQAVSDEDYRQASVLKLELEAADPSILLRLRLEEAVSKEKYEEAAELKARLDELLPPPPPKFEPGPTSSDTVTEGIRVKVKSFFVASQSVAGSTFTFAYR